MTTKGQTYFDRAQAEAEIELGGRFAALKPVVGGAPPRIAGSPWATPDPVPAEPPLGFSVDAMEPVGTEAEIERSKLWERSMSEGCFDCGVSEPTETPIEKRRA